MKKETVFFILTAFLSAFPAVPANAAARNTASVSPEVCFDEVCFRVETAVTDAERHRGLMHRDTLASGEAMLFFFEKEGILPIWMKNVRFPLDILWLDREGRIVHFEENVPPCTTRDCPSYYAPGPAAFVLETPAGSIGLYGLEKGDRADLSALSGSPS